MKNIFSVLARNQSLIYKVFLFIIATFLIIFLLPKGGQFKYHFQKGKPWQYENLYAPFSFTIKKDKETIEKEKETIIQNAVPYFDRDLEVSNNAKSQFKERLNDSYVDSLYTISKKNIQQSGLQLLNAIYKNGVIDNVYPYTNDKPAYLKDGKNVKEVIFGDFFKLEDLDSSI